MHCIYLKCCKVSGNHLRNLALIASSWSLNPATQDKSDKKSSWIKTQLGITPKTCKSKQEQTFWAARNLSPPKNFRFSKSIFFRLSANICISLWLFASRVATVLFNVFNASCTNDSMISKCIFFSFDIPSKTTFKLNHRIICGIKIKGLHPMQCFWVWVENNPQIAKTQDMPILENLAINSRELILQEFFGKKRIWVPKLLNNRLTTGFLLENNSHRAWNIQKLNPSHAQNGELTNQLKNSNSTGIFQKLRFKSLNLRSQTNE